MMVRTTGADATSTSSSIFIAPSIGATSVARNHRSRAAEGKATTASTGGAWASTICGAGASSTSELLGPVPSPPRRGDGGWLCRRAMRGEAWRRRRGVQQRQDGAASAWMSRTTELKMWPKRPGQPLAVSLPGIDCWLRSQALNGLREIEFRYKIENSQLPYPLPPSALRFAPTLCVADFGNCDFPREMAPLLKFPCLKQLTLYSVIVLEDALHSLLCGCPVLESLLLYGNAGFRRLRINSPTLRSIGISVSHYRARVENRIMLQDLIIEDAPCLEKLLLFDLNHCLATIRVVWAPKLEVLGLLSDGITKLDLGTTVFQKMIALSMTTSMRTVKVLAHGSRGPNLDSVVDLLKCFPCVQKLYVESQVQKSRKNKWCYNPLDPVGMRPDVDFAKFFVLNAKVLKKMVFGSGYPNTTNSDKWMTDQHKRLQLDKRASQGARFKFICASGFIRFEHYQQTHDLWMDDPFDSHILR